ncbi:NAD(P)H-hydrate dehydratase [Xanthomonas medicagonis]|uniref:NAD(P)H-hydrate dehydratase n=1 Tax=Xanthomonas medicagonis TaxID=3160841 RepID=UPI0035194E59
MSRVRAIPVTAALLRRWPLPTTAGIAGKEQRGRVLVIGGSCEIPGAALLAAEAALRAGAGKLQIATARPVAMAMAVALPEARVVGLPASADGELRLQGAALRRDVAGTDALLIGPGMRGKPALRAQIAQLLATGGCAAVLDAGALVQTRGMADPGRIVLTPHHGEMAALSGVPIERIGADPMAVAVEYAQRSGAIVVLKSATTVIAAPDGARWVHRGGSPCLGTSGSGDVLAGIVCGLLARGASATQAAVWGVHLHACAGAALAQRVGPLGPLAREIAPQVPGLLAMR